MSVSESQKRAKAKYNAKTYKRLAADVKIADYEFIDNYCKTNNISKARLLVNSVKYCVENKIEL